MSNKSLLVLTAIVATATSAPAAVILNVSDTRPGETANTVATTTLGSVSSTANVPTATYTITGLDLTSVGGGASEQIVFDIDYTQTNGSGVQVNGFGNISVTGGSSDNMVDGDETITATLSLNSTTFTGDISLGFVSFATGGVSNFSDESWDIIHENGTVSFVETTDKVATFAPSSFVTLDPVAGPGSDGGTFNVQGFDVEISTAIIPEPASLSLLALGSLLIASRRRRNG